MDDFEKRIQRQPPRSLPTEWRAGILAAANAATDSRKPVDGDSRFHLRSWLRELVWPNPRAWVGLASVWILIFALKFSTDDEARVARHQSPVSPEVIAEWRRQKLIFAELVGTADWRAAKPPKSIPSRPRSDRSRRLMGV